MNSYITDSLTSCSISFNPSVTQTIGEAIFTITTKNNINVGGSIALVLPQVWVDSVSSSSSPLTGTSPVCTKVSGDPLQSPLPCTLYSQERRVFLSPAFATATTSPTQLVFKVANLRSPPTTNGGNRITVNTYMQDNSEVDSSECSVVAVSPKTVTFNSTSQFLVGASSQFSV